MPNTRLKTVNPGGAGSSEQESATLEELLDRLVGTALGTLVYRGATGWTSLAPPATDGQILASSGGVPTWLPAGATGKVLTGVTGSVPTWQ